MSHVLQPNRVSIHIEIIGFFSSNDDRIVQVAVSNALPEIATEMGGEEAVDERVGGWIERRQTLDESGNGDHRLALWYVAVNLQQVKDDVRRPAQNEDYQKK